MNATDSDLRRVNPQAPHSLGLTGFEKTNHRKNVTDDGGYRERIDDVRVAVACRCRCG